ncbi:outer membrane beta-barrel protein [Rhizobium sp.]
MTRCLAMRPNRPTAVLLAGVLATHLSLGLAGTALAQSATLPDQTSTSTDQSRLGPDSEREGAVDFNVPDDGDDAAGQDQSATAPGTRDRGLEDPSDVLEAENLQELRRQNMRESTVDGLRTATDEGRNDVQGVRVGTFILRPALTETIGSERTTTGKDTSSRSYLRSSLRTSLTSDWDLHELKIDAEGTWEKTLSGVRQDDPEAKINGELRLDLSDQTTAKLRAGYSLTREEIGDPNAVANAVTQAEVNEYTLGAEVARDLGVLRATAGLDFTRQTYGDVTLADGILVDQSARNNNESRIRGRLGYELSPALIPFLEASYSRVIYDQRVDGNGYVRDADLYATKAGVEVDMGEKLRGELAAGYLTAEFDDSALKSISAATIDGNAVWSPRRGTDIAWNLRTEIEPTTTAGDSGSTAYTGTMVLSQIILENLTGQVSSGLTLRDYSNDTTPVQSVLSLGTGLTWSISRSLDLNTDITWEKTQQQGSDSTEVLRAGIGLTLKR